MPKKRINRFENFLDSFSSSTFNSFYNFNKFPPLLYFLSRSWHLLGYSRFYSSCQSLGTHPNLQLNGAIWSLFTLHFFFFFTLTSLNGVEPKSLQKTQETQSSLEKIKVLQTRTQRTLDGMVQVTYPQGWKEMDSDKSIVLLKEKGDLECRVFIKQTDLPIDVQPIDIFQKEFQSFQNEKFRTKIEINAFNVPGTVKAFTVIRRGKPNPQNAAAIFLLPGGSRDNISLFCYKKGVKIVLEVAGHAPLFNELASEIEGILHSLVIEDIPEI